MSEEEKRIRRLRNVKSRVREDMQVNSEQGPTLGGMVERGGEEGGYLSCWCVHCF